MNIFKSKKDRVFGSLFLGILLILFISLVFAYFDMPFVAWLFMAFVFLVIILFLLISFFLLRIRIEGEELVVRVIFDVFRISVFKIIKIRIGETMWSGLHKYGTSTGGLIIFSKNSNDLYITPEEQDRFLKELLKINRHIIIEDVRKI